MKTPSLITAVLMLAAGAAAPRVTAQEVELNDTRRFQVTGETAVRRNGVLTPPESFIQIGTGYRAEIQIGTGIDSGLTRGALRSIDFVDRLAGPVTSVDPLAVLTIPVVATGDTVRIAVPGGDLAALGAGDELLVSGYGNADSSVRATRIERAAGPLAQWRLEGFARNVSATGFTIGLQPIDTRTAVLQGCPGTGVTEGRLVDAEILPVSGYVPGEHLVAAVVTCREDRILGEGPALIDGLITTLTGADRFLVGDQIVLTDAGTRYFDGTSRDVRVGVRVEVEGAIDPGTRVLTATRVKFRDSEVRFEAPVARTALVPGESITVLRNTLALTVQTEIDDDLFDDDLDEGKQLSVRGFADRDGRLFAIEVEEAGDASLEEVDLRGPAVRIEAPGLTILGVFVDTSLASFEDALGESVTAQEFFALIDEGTSVGVEDARYDPITNTLTGGTVTIETEGDDDRDDESDDDDDDDFSKGQGVAGRGIGIVSAVSVAIFRDGFE